MDASDNEKLVLTAWRLPESVIEELRLVAKQDNRTLSEQARIALKQWLAENPARQAA